MRKGDLLVQLDGGDYLALVAQAKAGVEAAFESNRHQRQLLDSRVDRAPAGIDQTTVQIAAAQAGEEAVQADVTRTCAEGTRQESLVKAHSSTQQKLRS